MQILFAYDGSTSADAAIVATASILSRGHAAGIVLAVWEPLVVERLPIHESPAALHIDTDAGASARQAQALAVRGARLANRAGVEALPFAIDGGRPVPETVIGSADDLGADLIVLGASGLGRTSSVRGSVCNYVLAHAHRPVLVVPSPIGGAGAVMDELATANTAYDAW
jgi:nucleotide-binding universal stress UspA family protein